MVTGMLEGSVAGGMELGCVADKVVAKEYMTKAVELSRVLEQHIREVRVLLLPRSLHDHHPTP